MLKWIQRLGHELCGFNTGQKEEAYAPRAVDEGAHSGEEEEPSGEHMIVSGESSPAHSSSSPYIPISECFTGNPVVYNDEVAYCNVTTSFPFPPRQNGMGTGRSQADPPVPPPRPPKTLPSSDSVTYLQLDTKMLSEVMIHSGSKVSHHRSPETSGDVEYRMIDHVKTKALNQMRLEREEQLRTPAVKKNFVYNKGG